MSNYKQTERFNYDASLQRLMKRFSWTEISGIVYFWDKFKSSVRFAMYANDEILENTKSIRDNHND